MLWYIESPIHGIDLVYNDVVIHSQICFGHPTDGISHSFLTTYDFLTS